MTYALLVVFIASNLLWLAYLRERDRRETEQRQTLLDRIEAPGQVVIQREVESGPDLQAVEFDNDEDFWKAKKEAVNG